MLGGSGSWFTTDLLMKRWALPSAGHRRHHYLSRSPALACSPSIRNDRSGSVLAVLDGHKRVEQNKHKRHDRDGPALRLGVYTGEYVKPDEVAHAEYRMGKQPNPMAE